MPEPYHIVQEIQKYNLPDYRPRMEQFQKVRSCDPLAWLRDSLSNAVGSVTGYQESQGGPTDAEESRLCVLAVSCPRVPFFRCQDANQTTTIGRKRVRSISSGRTIPRAEQVAGR